MNIKENFVSDEEANFDALALSEESKKVNERLGEIMTTMQKENERPTLIAVFDEKTRQVHVVTGLLDKMPEEERHLMQELLFHATEV